MGRRTSGSFASDTIAAAREVLRKKGLAPTELREATFASNRLSIGGLGRARRREKTSEFARQLSMLLKSGVPLVEALDVLIRQSQGRFRTVMQDLRDRVAAGTALHEAMAVHPTWFDIMFQSAASVGQRSGRLEQSLRTLAEYENDRAVLRGRLLTALAYPAILCVLGIAVVLFLMTYVVPQLLTVLEENGQALPTPTQWLKDFSDLITGHWGKLLLAGLCAFAAIAAARTSNTGRRLLCNFQLHMPLLGVLVRKSIVAQFAQTMTLLLQNGISFVEALRLTRTSTNHCILAAELEGMESAIQRGSDIAPTIQQSRIFPALVAHLVNVGQKAGELPEILQQLKEGYDTEVKLALGKFAAALEPILIIVMSVVVGFVVLAIMLPILETTRSIH